MSKYGIEVRTPGGSLVGIFKNLLSASLEESLNAPEQMNFSVPVDDLHSSAIISNNEFWIRDRDAGTVKSKCRLLGRRDIRSKGTTLEANCLGLISQLDGELVELYDTGDAGKTITQIVTDLLAMQVSANPITIGTIEPTVTRAIQIEGNTILKALWQLRETVGGYISVNTARQLNWLNDVGEDKGQQIRYRKNLKGITREADYTEVVHKLYPYGAGETDAKIKLSNILVGDETAIKSSDATYGFLTLGGQYSCYKNWTGIGNNLPAEMVVKKNGIDNSSVWRQGANEQILRCTIADFDPAATYTITYRHADYLWDGTSNPVIRQKVDKSFTYPDTILAWARLYLGQYRLPSYSYQVDMIDLSERDPGFSFDTLQLGSIVKVIDEDLGIDISAKIVKIKHPDLLNPEEVEIEIANRVKDITDVLGEVYDTQQLNQSIATKIGAGQVVVLGEFTVADWRAGSTTNIKGDVIRTGVIQSNNWQAGGQGSWIDLTNGLVKMGHYDDPEFYWDGSQLHVKGDIIISGYLQVGGAANDINTHGTTIDGGKITAHTITINQLNFTPVDSSNIIASINASSEGITIDTPKLNLTGVLIVGGAAADVNAHSTIIEAGKISIVGKSLTDLTNRTADNISPTASRQYDDQSASARANAGLDSSGFVSKVIQGVKIAGTPVTGLNMTGDYMGYYDGSQWRSYIRNNGQFYFYGSANNFIEWDGANLTVKGNIYAINGEFTGTLKTTTLDASSTLSIYGNIYVYSGSLTIVGQLLKFSYGGSQSGVIGSAGANDIQFVAGANRDLWIQGAYEKAVNIASQGALNLQANTVITVNNNFRPNYNNGYNLGDASYKWAKLWATESSAKVVQDSAAANTMYDILPYNSASWIGGSSNYWPRAYISRIYANNLMKVPVGTNMYS